MKQADKDKMMESILNSMKNGSKAKPQPELYSKIEQILFGERSTVLTIRNLIINSAAAILILLINFTVLNISKDRHTTREGNEVVVGAYNHEYISSFQIYD